MTRQDVQRIFETGRRVRQLEMILETKNRIERYLIRREIQRLRREILEDYDIRI